MTSLRERQKTARRDAIFRAAARLFATRGYTATSMEDIAAAAGVSVPTIYAYYPAKGDLMVAIYAADRAVVDHAKQALIDNPPADPAEAVAEMLLAELRTGADYLDNAIWREVVSTSIRAAGDYQAGLDRLNETVFDVPMRRLLEVLRERGAIRADAAVDDAVALFSDLAMAVFHQQIARDHPWEWVERRVRAHAEVAVAGLRPATGTA